MIVYAQELMALGGVFLKSTTKQVGGSVELSHLYLTSTMCLGNKNYVLFLEQRETDLTKVIKVLDENELPSAEEYKELCSYVCKQPEFRRLRAMRVRLLAFCMLVGSFFVGAAVGFMIRVFVLRANFSIFVGSLLLFILGIIIFKNRFRAVQKLLPFYQSMSEYV